VNLIFPLLNSNQVLYRCEGYGKDLKYFPNSEQETVRQNKSDPQQLHKSIPMYIQHFIDIYILS